MTQGNSSKFISNMQQLQDSVAKYVAAIDQQVCVTGLLGLQGASHSSLWPVTLQPVHCRLSAWKWKT